MGRSVEDLKLVLENSFGHVWKYDVFCSRVKFDEKVYLDTYKSKRLKIAYIMEDEFSGVTVSTKNTMNETI